MKRWIPILVIIAMFLSFAGMGAYAEDYAYGKDVVITGKATGLGEADAWINDSSAEVKIDTGWESGAAFDANVVLRGGEPIHAVVFADDEGIYFAFPEATEEKYFISFETFSSLGSEYGINVQGSQAAAGALSSLSGLGEIIFGIQNDQNTTQRTEDYALPGLGETVPGCTVTACTPTKEEWSQTITALVEELKGNEELMGLLEAGVKQSYAAAAGSQSMSEEEYTASVMQSIEQGLDSLAASADSYAEMLTGTTIETARSGAGVVAVKGIRDDGSGFGYEGLGSLSDSRRDALVMYASGEGTVVAMNTVSMTESGISGRLSIDMLDAYLTYTMGDGSPYFELRGGIGDATGFSLTVTDDAEGMLVIFGFDAYDAVNETDQAMEIRAVIRDSGEEVFLPEGDWMELETKEEIQEVFQNSIIPYIQARA